MFNLRSGVVFLFFAALVAPFTVSAQGPTYAPGQTDYLTPQLRAKVEQLKVDVAAERASKDTVMERIAVLWDWANAYALAGGVVPVMLPFEVAQTLSWNPGAPRGLRSMVVCDRYVRELQIREESPDGIGTLTNDAKEPFPPGSWQTLVQTYTVGELGMATGGAILVGEHDMSDHGRFQRDDPARDNYVTVACSNPSARFKNTTGTMFGMHGGYSGKPLKVFKLAGGTLKKGDTISVTYGDKSGGSRGFRVQTWANDFFPLPLYVDIEGRENFFTLPIQPYAVRGREPHAVKAFAPSVVAVNEAVVISVRTEDRYYNRASGPIPKYEVSLNGSPHSTIPAGENALTLLSDLRFDTPGVYRFQFRSPDGTITGSSNPIWVQEDPEQRIYWGETHGHGGFAEGQGSQDWFFRFGREDARLDFLSYTEHDLWMDDGEWKLMGDAVKKYHEEKEFVVFLGYEWSMQTNQGGHHNVLFRTSQNRRRVNIQRAPSLSELYFNLRAENDFEDVLIIPHAHTAGDWRITDPDLEKLIEIQSMHGTFRWFGERYVERGYQMGFIAASDNHHGHPGYTNVMGGSLVQKGGLAGVMAPEKTSDAIFDALRNLATYATSGERMILDVSLNGSPMGSRAPGTIIEGGSATVSDRTLGERRIRAKVIGTFPIDTITVFKNGKAIAEEDYITTTSKNSDIVEVSFQSPTEEFFRESPRGFRFWRGTMEIEGAELVTATAPGFQNPYLEWVRRDENNENLIHFATATRGRTNAILLELKNIAAAARVAIRLEASTERPSTPQQYRRLAKIPGEDVTLLLAGSNKGKQVREFKVDRYTDTIAVRYVNPAVAYDREFEFADDEMMLHGDYYYIRVKQLDGALAWSSPIWVGGVPPT